jgi:excisionase family DNA binding protein
MTTTEAARSMGVSDRRVRQLIDLGTIKAVRIETPRGAYWEISPEDVEAARTRPTAGKSGRPSVASAMLDAPKKQRR